MRRGFNRWGVVTRGWSNGRRRRDLAKSIWGRNDRWGQFTSSGRNYGVRNDERDGFRWVVNFVRVVIFIKARVTFWILWVHCSTQIPLVENGIITSLGIRVVLPYVLSMTPSDSSSQEEAGFFLFFPL